MVEASEGGIEFLAGIVGETGAVALDETVLVAAPFAGNGDGIVELGRADLGEDAGDQHLGDEAFAVGCDRRLVVLS